MIRVLNKGVCYKTHTFVSIFIFVIARIIRSPVLKKKKKCKQQKKAPKEN